MKISALTHLALRQIESSARRLLGFYPRPYKILLELTTRCNSRCQTCDIWQIEPDHRQDLSLETARSLLDQLGRDLSWIAFSGGEPTLYRDFEALAALIRAKCPNLRILTFTTNGLWPERALLMAKALSSIGAFLFVTVSLEGDRETHDRVRRIPGGYERALKTRDLLEQNGFRVFFGITLGSHNASFVRERMQNFSEVFKAVTFVHSGGIYRKENREASVQVTSLLERVLSFYRASTLEEWLEKMYMRVGLEYFHRGENKGKKTNVIPCSVIQTSLHVEASGAVRPCMFLPALAIAGRDDLRSVLRSDATRLRQRGVSRGDCPSCWMNCYAVHTMASHPVKTGFALARGWARKRFAFAHRNHLS